MADKLQIHPAIAWQSYDQEDLLFILNHQNHYFYFFRDSGRQIIEYIFEVKDRERVLELCRNTYEVEEKLLINTIDEYIDLLIQEGILI